MSESPSVPAVNAEVPPSLVFGKNATNVKKFPKTSPSGSGETNFSEGIPAEYSATLKARLDDLNGIGRISSGLQYYRQSGGIVTYDAEVAAVIEGYPKDAVLEYWDGTHLRKVVSLIENNLYNFNETPDYIDGIHWGYCDNWGSPNCIFVDPSRATELVALQSGSENSDLGWTTDNTAYNYYIVDGETTQYSGKMDLRKSKWIRIEHDSFVIISVRQTDDFPSGGPVLYYVYAGYRMKGSDGKLVTFSMTTDAIGTVTNASVFPVYGGAPFNNGSAIVKETNTGSTCLYMRGGSMVQLVYADDLYQVMDITMKVVRLKRR